MMLCTQGKGLYDLKNSPSILDTFLFNATSKPMHSSDDFTALVYFSIVRVNYESLAFTVLLLMVVQSGDHKDILSEFLSIPTPLTGRQNTKNMLVKCKHTKEK